MMSSEDQFPLQQPYLSAAGHIEEKVSSHSETMPLRSRNTALAVQHSQAKTELVILSETKALYSGDTGPSKSADLKLENSEIKLEHEASPKTLESRPHQLNSSSAFSGHSDKPIKAAQMHPSMQPVRDSQGYQSSTKISSTTHQGHSFPYPRNTFSGSTSTYPTANNNYRFQIRDKPNFQKSYGAPNELVRGPRANRLKPHSSSSVEKDNLNPSAQRDQYNKSDFQVKYENAKFYMIKSYSEDDIHKSIKYSVWASTANGNNKLDAAFQEAEMEKIDKGIQCPIFLFFSVNASGQFVGLAEMTGPVDFKKTMDFWQQDKWNGFFPVQWHIIKDIPNRNFQHITLENNDNRAVTFSRDTQEIKLPQGLKMLQIFKAYQLGTSILDDFDFYEEKEKSLSAKRHEPALAHSNSDSLDECSLESLESSFRNMKVQERPQSYLESQYQPRARSYFETQYQGRPRSYFESQYQAKPRSFFESQFQAKPRSYFETQYQGRPRSYFESQYSHNNFRSDSASQYSNSNRRPYVSSCSTVNRS